MNYAVSGTRVWSYHAANLLIHLLAALTLWGIVRRTLELRERNRLRPSADGPPGRARRATVALLIALLWTVHPLQTESVTYIIQRAVSLMGRFYLLTSYCFGRGIEGGESGRPAWRAAVGWFGLSWLACLFGMGTKEVMVSAPVIVFLYDRTFVSGSFHAAWQRHRRVHLALAATWIALAGLVAAGGGNRSGTIGLDVPLPWSAYALTQFVAIAKYLRLALWPQPLVFNYETFWISRPSEVLPAALLVVALAGGTLWALRRRPALGFLGIFFFAILAPTSLVPGVNQMIAEHRMYLALAPVMVLGVLAIERLARAARPVRAPAGLAAAGLLLAALGCLLTARRNAVYRTELSLWADTAAQRPGNPAAAIGLGNALVRAGQAGAGIAQYERALRLRPDSADAHLDLGNALAGTGRWQQAILEYGRALALRPGQADTHYNLGLTLRKAGRTAEAIAQFEETLRLQPGFAAAGLNLGDALDESGQGPAAVAAYRRTLVLAPGYAPAHFNLGVTLENAGRMPEAIAEFEQTLRLQPDFPKAHNNLGIALAQSGRMEEAMAQLREAVRLEPGDGAAHANLGLVLRAAGRAPEAAAEFAEAARLQASR